MSIYSGFATRAQEEAYDQCIDSLLYVLQKRLIKFYQQQPTDEDKFISILAKLHSQMKNMENSKYLEPKTSVAVTELVKFLHAHQQAILKQSRSRPQISATPTQLPSIQAEMGLPEGRADKKSSLWVEKSPKNSNAVEQEVQTMGTIYLKKEPKDESIEKAQPRRTLYGPLTGLRPKESSRNNFSRAKKGEQGSKQLFKLNKNRSASNNLPEAGVKVNSITRESALPAENHPPRKKKSRVSSKMGNTQLDEGEEGEEENENEVADIIKEYMARTKKNYWAEQKGREKEGVN